MLGEAGEVIKQQDQATIAWAEFDPAWYLRRYPDVRLVVADADTDPDAVLRFYLATGQQLGHSPNPWFDEAWYLQQNPTVAAAVSAGEYASGFDEYCRSGYGGRSPHWLYHDYLYRIAGEELAAETLLAGGFVNHYDHYLRHGSRDGRTAHLLFDAAHYLSQLDEPEADAARQLGAYRHFLLRIAAAQPAPRTSVYFDPDWYRRRYPAIAAQIGTAWICALHHYLTNATPTEFDPLPEFSEITYLETYPDIAAGIAAGGVRNGYQHFLSNGVFELRSPCEAIDLHYYVREHASVGADLTAGRARDAFAHLLLIGRAQGLVGKVGKRIGAAEPGSRLPDHPVGHQVGFPAARELKRFDEAAITFTKASALCPTRACPVAEAAWTARARGDSEEAFRLAAELRAQFPDNPHGYQVGAAAARELNRFDEAVTILTEGAARFSTQSWPVAEAAWTAKARGRSEEALRLAAELRMRFPDNPVGYHVGVAAARELKRLDEAVTILTEGGVRFPMDAWPVAEAAWTARDRGDTEGAIRLAAELRVRFPNDPTGYQIGAAAARALRRFDEAATISTDASARFPTQGWPVAEAAWTARARGDIAEAIQLAADLRSRFPDDPTGYQSGATFLRIRGRLDEAEVVLREAITRFPAQAWPEHEIAATARRRSHHAKAARMIDALRNAANPMMQRARHPVQCSRKIVVVLGMHRAGTSLCARIIQRLGIELGGPLMAPGFDNPDGYQEHMSIFECHEALFELLGATWDTLRLVRPPPPSFWRSEEVMKVCERLQQLVVQQVETVDGSWAFKDPRTVRFLPLWKEIFEAVGIQPLWVLSVRHPRAVAASLLARDGIPPDLGDLLWVEHYLDALRHLGPHIAGIVHYEKWFSAPGAQIKDLATMIGGASTEAIQSASECVRHDLRHDVAAPDDSLLDVARHVYSWLSVDTPDLRALQYEAEAVWRSIEVTAPD